MDYVFSETIPRGGTEFKVAELFPTQVKSWLIDDRNEPSITEGQSIAWFPVLCFRKTSFCLAGLTSIVSTMTNPAYTTEQLVYCPAFYSETWFQNWSM